MIRDFRVGRYAPLVLGHRGDPSRAPENSVEAVVAARESGADGVEIDVRLTSDGVPVLSHDDEIAGLSVGSTTWDQLAELGISSLRQVLSAADDLMVNLEIKGPVADPDATMGTVADVLSVTKGQVLVTSFWPEIVDAAGRAMPMCVRGVLTSATYDADGSLAVSIAEASSCEFALPENPAIGEAAVVRAHKSGLAIIAWTVDDPVRMQTLSSWGVDGVITNDPRGARRALG